MLFTYEQILAPVIHIWCDNNISSKASKSDASVSLFGQECSRKPGPHRQSQLLSLHQLDVSYIPSACQTQVVLFAQTDYDHAAFLCRNKLYAVWLCCMYRPQTVTTVRTNKDVYAALQPRVKQADLLSVIQSFHFSFIITDKGPEGH